MKTTILGIFAILFLHFHAFNQTCLPEGITLSSQEEIDDFPNNYPDCTIIEGDVIILGDDITNLENLSQLTSIEGNFTIGGVYYGNPNLGSLVGLDNIVEIRGMINIIKNDSLFSLHGLESLAYVGEHVKIWGNRNLATLFGLNNLVIIQHSLIIYENTLINLSGLEKLKSVENLVIFNNSLLTLSGIQNLTFVGDEIKIEGNSHLVNISGIRNIVADSIKTLTIKDNIHLSNCEIQTVCNFLSVSDSIAIIENNGIGCNSIDEILEACGLAR